MYYSGAAVSSAALLSGKANLYPGMIHKCDVSLIYRFTNTLYKLHMTGAQLKKYMEWSAGYFNTYRPGDLTISFNPDVPLFNYDMFSGVNYELNIANPPGSRIENLTWPDGTPVEDDDEFDLAANNYRVNSCLLSPGVIFEEGEEFPILLEEDMRADIGGVRELIRDYIITVKGGVISPECDGNWRITGNDWDEELHQKAVRMLSEGRLTLPASPNGRDRNVSPITEEDVEKADSSGYSSLTRSKIRRADSSGFSLYRPDT